MRKTWLAAAALVATAPTPTSANEGNLFARHCWLTAHHLISDRPLDVQLIYEGYDQANKPTIRGTGIYGISNARAELECVYTRHRIEPVLEAVYLNRAAFDEWWIDYANVAVHVEEIEDPMGITE